MIIFPAIDIKDGQCVRLKQGKFDEITVYSKNPGDIAKLWEQKGAKFIHVVDLDGAKEGQPKNMGVIEEIVKNVNIPIQVGGGIRTVDSIKMLIEKGVQRVILGTAAITNLDFTREMVVNYGDRIVISIDAKGGLVATDGWLKTSKTDSIELLKKLEEIGVSTVVYTDIAKDGMMEGPNFEIYKELRKISKVNIIASGGISGLEDINGLQRIGIYGAIVGKALYQGSINLEEIGDKHAS